MLLLLDRDAVVFGTCRELPDWLGRDLEGIVGHSCREWCHSDDWEPGMALHREAFDQNGVRSVLVRNVLTDGSESMTSLIVRPVWTAKGKPMAITTVQALRSSHDGLLAVPSAFDVAEYAEQMAQSLAEMLGNAGITSLQESFELVAGEAAAIVERLRKKALQ